MKLRHTELVAVTVSLVIWLGWHNHSNNEALQQAFELSKQADVYYRQGQYALAIPLWQKSLAIFEKVLGKEHPNVATSLNNLAELYRTQGDYARAEPLFQRSLAIREKVLGKEHPDVAQSLNNLATLYHAQGDYARAEPLFQRSLAIREKVLGKEHPYVAQSLNNLALLYHAQGNYARAEPLYQRSLAIREKVLGKEHPEVATSLNNLALLYKNQGDYARAEPVYQRYARAEPLFQRALAIREKVLGEEHPDVVASLNNLAELYNKKGDYARAEPLYQRSLATREKVLGKEHPEVADSLNNLAGLLYDTQGDPYARAEPLLKRSLAILEKVLGKEHPDPGLATSLDNLAGLYRKQGDYARVELLYQRSLAIREKVLGKEHPEVATSLNNLAALYRNQGDYARAEPLYQRSLAIREKVLGKEHPKVADSLGALAILYNTQGDYARAETLYQRSLAILDKQAKFYYTQRDYTRAEPLYQRSLAIREKVLGEEHPDVATSLNNLAELYDTQGYYARAKPLYQHSLAILDKQAKLHENQGDYARAEPLYQRSLAIQEKALGKEHPDVATSLNTLAELYRNQGDYARAEPLYQRALAIREKVLGKEHSEVADSLIGLATLYNTQGDHARAEPLYQRSLAILDKQAKFYDKTAKFYYTRRDYVRAKPHLKRSLAIREKALAIREKALGKEHPEVADNLDNLAEFYQTQGDLAEFYQTQGDYARAEPLFQRSLAIREKVLGKEHPEVATSLIVLAGLYYKQGDYARAEPLYQRLLATREKILEHPEVATSLNVLAGLYYKQGDYARAKLLYQRLLAIREKVLGKEHPEVATSLNDLAGLYYTQGDYVRAEPLYQRSLAIREKVLGKEHPEVATSLNNLAGFYYKQGDYARAEPLYQRSLAIREKVLGKKHPEVATSLNNLATLYDIQGDYARAKPLYQRSLEILSLERFYVARASRTFKSPTMKTNDEDFYENLYGKPHNDATNLNNQATIMTNLNNRATLQDGKYFGAESTYQHSLAIRERVLGKEHPYVAESLNNLAELYLTQGDYARAEPLHQRSLAIREKVFGKEHPDVARSLYNLATLYSTQGDHARAEPLYQRALKIAEHSDQPELLWHIQYGFSQLLAKQNKPAVAIFFGKRAVNTLQKLRGNVTEEFQKSFLKDKTDVYKDLANLLIDQGRLPEAEQVLDMLKEEEYFDFIRRTAQDDPRITQAVYTRIEQPWVKRYDEIHTQLASLRRELAGLNEKKTQHIPLTPEEEIRYPQLERDMTMANQAFDTFLAELYEAFKQTPAVRKEDFAEKDLKNLQTLQNILRDLGQGVVMVTYLITENKLRIIVTTPEVQLARDAPVTEKELNGTIEEFRRRIETHDDYRMSGNKLYNWLINPIADDLAQAQSKVLMVSLDGTLRYLPLAALNGSDGLFLAEKYAVVVYTAAAKDKLKAQPTEHWKLAGLGVSKEFPDFPPLPNVEEEFRKIVRRTPDDQQGVIDGVVYLNQDFTAKRLSDLLTTGDYPVMHIASHFRFSPEGDETTSFLLLGDGNRLSIAEIRKQYQFPKVDLLTLSACNTAMGNYGTGKEIEGFGVSAQRNGAKGVLASLWAVDDSSTAVFMQYLYRLHNMNTTPLNKALALQAAQKLFIEEKEVQGYRHPYYWAPFILMGNWL